MSKVANVGFEERDASNTVAAKPLGEDLSQSRDAIPRWHFAMINDGERNAAFAEAISAIDLKGKTVIDIGAGTGLLSMIAARHGAGHVYACESNEAIAEIAKRIIEANGLGERITVIAKKSTTLVPGMDVPFDINVMISETVDCGFVGEGFLPALLHARHELLAAGAELIPVRFSLKACLLSSEAIYDLNRVRPVFGFDVNDFNQFSTPGYFPVRSSTWDHKLASNVVDCATFDLKAENHFSCNKILEFTVNSDSVLHGVLFWFEMWLNDNVRVTNSPDNSTSHWMQAVQVFERPLFATRGEVRNVLFSMQPTFVSFEIGG